MAKTNALVRSKLTKAQSLAASGHTADALQLLSGICKKDPRNAEAWFTRGTILGNIGKFTEAVDCLRRSTSFNPRHGLAYFNLGNALSGLGEFHEAANAFSRALKLDPRRPEIFRALARAEVNCGRPREAIRSYRQYLRFFPNDPGVYGNLGACLFHTDQLEEARKCYQQALVLKRDAAWFDGLGGTLCRQGKVEEAVNAHREAVKLQPDNARHHSNLLLSLHYLADISAADILVEHQRWDEMHRADTVQSTKYDNMPDRERRLRIGYVSPDFRTHSVSYFFEPLLLSHNAEVVEIWCYAISSHQDETSRRLQNAAHHWWEIGALSDPQAIAQIRADGIDILVDLAGHTAGNRLGVFAARAAPVQVTWLGYPATTGLQAMDYRITDTFADPQGYEAFCSEKLVRLTDCFLCYEPPAQSPAESPCPAIDSGYVTFGSFNNLAKINEGVVTLWSELLNEFPTAYMLIKNPSLSDQSSRERCLEMFARHGISADRVRLMGLAVTTREHLDAYSQMDIALDTFPYNGTTTTCEALYMGVPVITLAGRAHAGRVGVSLLTSLGLTNCVAETHEDYVSRAGALAEDLPSLVELRKTLRSRMQKSPLCNGPAFAGKMEQAYRAMWNTWCDSKPQEVRQEVKKS